MSSPEKYKLVGYCLCRFVMLICFWHLSTFGGKMMTKFCRITDYGYLGGVCAGLAYALRIPTWLVRILWLILIFGYKAYVLGILIYLLLWLGLPKWHKTPSDYERICE